MDKFTRSEENISLMNNIEIVLLVQRLRRFELLLTIFYLVFNNFFMNIFRKTQHAYIQTLLQVV